MNSRKLGRQCLHVYYYLRKDLAFIPVYLSKWKISQIPSPLVLSASCLCLSTFLKGKKKKEILQLYFFFPISITSWNPVLTYGNQNFEWSCDVKGCSVFLCICFCVMTVFKVKGHRGIVINWSLLNVIILLIWLTSMQMAPNCKVHPYFSPKLII